MKRLALASKMDSGVKTQVTCKGRILADLGKHLSKSFPYKKTYAEKNKTTSKGENAKKDQQKQWKTQTWFSFLLLFIVLTPDFACSYYRNPFKGIFTT